MQINLDLPETLALRLSQGSYPAADVVEQGLHRLELEANQSVPQNYPKRSTYNRLSDWHTASPTAAQADSQVPDLMDFLDDLAQRRDTLLERLRADSEAR